MQDQSSDLSSQLRSQQLPSSMVAKEFGEVNVRRTEKGLQTDFTILMEPDGREAEGWRTGIALDASASMRAYYGRKTAGRVHSDLVAQYQKKGWVQSYFEDGRIVKYLLSPEAQAEVAQQGYHFHSTPNIIQPLSQSFTAYLARTLDRTGRTAMIYWACGDGKQIEVLGEISESQCRQLEIAGPQNIRLGNTTALTPAVKYFVENFANAKRGMYIFVTDGRIDDLENVKAYTAKLARDIEAGRHNYIKCILIGVGDSIDRGQLQELDDFDTGANVDIWDYKIASEMQGLVQIFAEVVHENQIVAAKASIYDSHGNLIKQFPEGLPAKVSVSMPANSDWFELEVNGQRIRQGLIAPSLAPATSTALVAMPSPEKRSLLSPLSIDLKLLPLLIGVAIAGFACAALAYVLLSSKSQQNQPSSSVIPIATSSSTNIEEPKTLLEPRDRAQEDDSSQANKPNNQTAANSSKPTLSSQEKDTQLADADPQLPYPNVIVYFDFDDARITPTEAKKLREFWTKLGDRQGAFTITGHTDAIGDYRYNLKLSQERSDAVIKTLQGMGLNDRYTVNTKALSASAPMESNKTRKGRSLNRRVVVSFQAKK